MKIFQWSDIHLDVGPMPLNFTDEQKEELKKSILVIPGDLTSDYKSQVIPFLWQVSELFLYVVYGFGNHEYWGNDIFCPTTFEDEIAAEKQQGRLLNVYFLEENMVELEGITFIGGTMWTDLNKNNYTSVMTVYSYMNDFRYIKCADTSRETLTPGVWMALHKSMISYLRKMLELLSDDQPVVVVTHHAPHYESIDVRFLGDDLNHAYYSDLTEFLMLFSEKFDSWNWMHGHTHMIKDYVIGTCRITCNPRGYQPLYSRGSENTGFNIFKYIEVGNEGTETVAGGAWSEVREPAQDAGQAEGDAAAQQETP